MAIESENLGDVENAVERLNRLFAELHREADGFSASITSAFRAAATGGKSFEGILDSLVLKLSGIAFDRAFQPISDSIGSVIGKVFNTAGLPGGPGGATALPFGLGGTARSAAPTVVNFAVHSPDAESFRKSEAQVTAMLARAVGRGRRGL